MKSISLIIDNQKVSAQEGDILLWVALGNGFYIPNVCALKERAVPFAGCRLCFVEIEGYPEPVTACTETIREGMVVKTKTAKVQKLQRAAFELILSTHHVDCGHCGKNKKCALQKIALHLKVKLKSKRLRLIPKNLPLDESHPLFTYDPDKCVLCGRCVWVCREQQKAGTLNFAYRGFDMLVTTFGDSLAGGANCTQCRKCVEACPVGALLFKEEQRIREEHNA
jgi:Uncharacterized anaerobic dehydrogenase